MACMALRLQKSILMDISQITDHVLQAERHKINSLRHPTIFFFIMVKGLFFLNHDIAVWVEIIFV